MVSVAFSLAQATAPVLTAVDATAPISVTIDTTAPTITSLNVPARAIPGFVVSWSAQDNLIGVSHYDVRYKSESSGWTDWVSTPVTQALFTEPGGHVYTFRVSATDGVGNESDWSESGQVTVSLVKKYYAAAGRRVAMRAEGVVYYLHGDHLGSTSLVTDGAGNVVAQQLYLPYGAPRWGSGTLPTDYRFTGQRSEEASLGSLYDYGARMYSPVLGRFLSADTIVPSPGNPQDLNRYAYVRNSPLKFVDPTGHYEFEEDPDDPVSFGTNVRSKHDYTHPNYRAGNQSDAQFLAGATAPIWVPAVAVGGEVAAEGIALAGTAGWEALRRIATLLSAQCLASPTCANWVYGVTQRPSSTSQRVTSIQTRYGPAVQEESAAAQAVRTQVQQGATLYRQGTFGVQQTTEGQFWALQNPATTANYAQQYGTAGTNEVDWVIGGTIKSGVPFIVRSAPAFGSNGGGTLEVATSPGAVDISFFYMP